MNLKIVGSSRGLGRELALKLGGLNATVVCIDLQTPDQESTSKDVTAAGGAAFYFQCDITCKDQVEKTIGAIEKEVGDITMLYHCCSLPSPRTVVTNPPSVKQTIDVSVTSYFYVSFHFIFEPSSATPYQVLSVFEPESKLADEVTRFECLINSADPIRIAGSSECVGKSHSVSLHHHESVNVVSTGCL